MEYKIIFVNWTKPFFHKEEAEGYNKRKLADLDNQCYDMVDYELVINQLAIKNARKYTNCKIKLYTDDIGYDFYKKNGMIELFDEVDVETLNQYNKSDIRAGKWWTSGKSIVIGKEKTPFLFLDNDFIIQEELPKSIFEYDLVHTQWEIQRGKFYVTKEMVNDIGVPIHNFVERMMMPNTSFLFMNSERLQQNYLKMHLDIVTKQYQTIPEWLWLMSDQGILGYCARELNSNVGSIENKAYLSYSEQFMGIEGLETKCGFTPMWVDISNDKSNPFEYYHIWLDKSTMKNNRQFRNKILQRLKRNLMDKDEKIII